MSSAISALVVRSAADSEAVEPGEEGVVGVVGAGCDVGWPGSVEGLLFDGEVGAERRAPHLAAQWDDASVSDENDDGHGPVIDGVDNVTAFMSLPEVLQSAALMVLLAADEVPDDELPQIEAALKALTEAVALPRKSAHYLSMQAHVFTALYLARHNGWSGL